MSTRKPTVTVETITPEQAAEYLKGNLVNRTISPARVALYAKQMRQGSWRMTGEAVAFNGRKLLQGQHRLAACVAAETPFTTVVVRGISPEAMKVMDSGRARTAANAFQMEGIPNAAVVAAAVKYAIAIDAGYPLSIEKVGLITRDELFDFYNRHTAEFVEGYHLAQACYKDLRQSKAGWTTLGFEIIRVYGVDIATEFMTAVGTGADLSKGDARLAFRNNFVNCLTFERRLLWQDVVANGIKAFNLWNDGKRVEKFQRWTWGSYFPEVIAP